MEVQEKMVSKFRERIDIDNIVRISKNKPVSEYVYAISLRAQPATYNKYQCIILQFTRDLEERIKFLCQVFYHLGLRIPRDGKIRLKKGIKLANGILVGDTRQVILKMVEALREENSEDFVNDWNEINYIEEDHYSDGN